MNKDLKDFANITIPVLLESESFELVAIANWMKLSMIEMEKKAQAKEEQLSSEPPMYYLQDTRSYVGNSPMWWGLGSRGYTTDLSKAQKYTYEQAMSQHRCRETDVPWLCSEIDPLAYRAVDSQYMYKGIRTRSEQLEHLKAK